MVVILCVGIAKGIEGESSRLQDQGLCEDDHHKPSTFSFISSEIEFRSERGHVLVHF